MIMVVVVSFMMMRTIDIVRFPEGKYAMILAMTMITISMLIKGSSWCQSCWRLTDNDIWYLTDRYDNDDRNHNSQGCLNDGILVLNLAKIIDSCQPPTAFQSSYYWKEEEEIQFTESENCSIKIWEIEDVNWNLHCILLSTVLNYNSPTSEFFHKMQGMKNKST